MPLLQQPGSPRLRRLGASAALFAALAGSLAAGPQGAPDDARLRQAWSFLTAQEQDDVASWFTAEALQLDCFQTRILRFVREGEPMDAGLFAAAEELPFFDPKVHAPAQPIARRRLKPDDARAVAARKNLLVGGVPGTLPSAWRYDWGRREVLRTGDFQSAQHVFEGALAGFAPGVDFAQALVERALDDGREQEVLAAFGHAYTDREGNVYGDVTLFDAWSSGREIEMPDVDVLGLLTTIQGRPPRWKAPVPDSEHERLYEAVGEHFAQARVYRGLRAALAQTFFVGSAALPQGYAPHLARLHGLWEEYESDPAKLVVLLDKSRDQSEVLLRWAKRFDKDAKRNAKASTRQATLDWDARQMRALLVRILDEYGALARTARPEPVAPAPKPVESGR